MSARDNPCGFKLKMTKPTKSSALSKFVDEATDWKQVAKDLKQLNAELVEVLASEHARLMGLEFGDKSFLHQPTMCGICELLHRAKEGK